MRPSSDISFTTGLRAWPAHAASPTPPAHPVSVATEEDG